MIGKQVVARAGAWRVKVGEGEVLIEDVDQREWTVPRLPERAYWLIEKIEDGSSEALTVHLRGVQRALSVFSHREEAELFLRLGRLTGGWRPRKREGTEIAQLLSGPCASIGIVALDPLPEMLTEKEVSLVSLSRERFIDRLTGGRTSRAARENSQRANPEIGADHGALVP